MVFIIVKHGDKKETLFNANCRVATLLDNIKLRCGCEKTTDIDLCDEKGCMRKLEENPKDNAIKFVKARECYVLVRKDRKDGVIRHTSLLKGLQIANPELLALIEGRTMLQEEASILSTMSTTERRMSRAADKRQAGHITTAKRKSRGNARV